MNRNQLKTFICVSECKSFSQAENLLYLSKQAIIKQMNLLESEVGTQLIVRSSQGIHLTPAGEIFLEGIKNLDFEIDQLIHRCQTGASLNTLYLPFAQNCEESPLTDIINEFMNLYPRIPIKYISVDYKQYLEKIQNGELSLCFYSYHPDIEKMGLSYTHIYYENLWCLMEKENSLAVKKELCPDDLIGKKLSVGSEYWASRIIDHYRNYLKLEIQVISPTAPSYMNACQNCGIALCNEWKKNHMPSLIARPLHTNLRLSSGIVVSNNPSPETELFLNTALSSWNLNL